MHAFLTLKGQKTGTIRGSITQKGHEGAIGVIAVSHSVESPRDAQSGVATGRRQHKPFVFTKELDRATPLLYAALCNNENLTEATFRFFASSVGAEGLRAETQIYTVRITNATIVSIEFAKQNIRDATVGRYPESEQVALVYQQIEWTWNDGGISAVDDWETRV